MTPDQLLELRRLVQPESNTWQGQAILQLCDALEEAQVVNEMLERALRQQVEQLARLNSQLEEMRQCSEWIKDSARS